jgi:hypothetical protein
MTSRAAPTAPSWSTARATPLAFDEPRSRSWSSRAPDKDQLLKSKLKPGAGPQQRASYQCSRFETGAEAGELTGAGPYSGVARSKGALKKKK